MSIQFNVVERGNPTRPDLPKKYYPSLQSSGRVTLQQVAERVANMSTLSTTDIMAAVESFLTIIPEELANGRIVELGDFGNFWLRWTADGAERPEEVRGSQVTRLTPRFNAGKRFKRVLRAVKFEKRS